MEEVLKGKKIIITLIVIVLLMDIVTLASVSLIYASIGMADLASAKLFQGIIRFILTVLLMYFLYKGHNWAKWISIVLFLIAGIIALLSTIASFHFLTFTIGAIYLIFGIILLVSKSVNDFFKYQRGIFKPEIDEDYHM